MFQLFFPILEKEHYYLLCADFETGRLEIIDNSASTESTVNKYGDTIDNGMWLFTLAYNTFCL